MTNHHNLVDELRSFIHSADQTLSDALKELATQYAAACREVNQRLSRCLEHLRQGLRSEAIHLAQAEPVLLDVLSALDFPERPQWEEITAMYGLNAAPALNLDAAKALNEAYAEEQPLDDMLKRHRLLALSRAALPARLMILRRIASMDTLNPVWADDVREFERARLREMHQEVEEATRRGDNAAVVGLAEEMRTSRWLVELPAGLVHHLEAVARQQAQAKALATLLRNESELNSAINAFDIGRARQLRTEIQGLTKAAGLRTGDPVLERVSSSLAWVDEQDRRAAEARKHEKAERELEQALDEQAPGAELEQMFHALEKSGRGLSAPLEARYQARLREQAQAAQRKTQFVRAGLAAGVLLLVSLADWLVYRSVQAGKIQEVRETVEGHLQANRVREARLRWDDLTRARPSLSQAPELVALLKQLQEAETRNERRRQQLTDGLKELATVADRQTFDQTASRLRGLVQTADEEGTLREAVQAWEQRQQQESVARNQKFRLQLDDLDRRAADLEKLVEQPRREDEARNRLAEMQREITHIENAVKGISNELHAAVRAQENRLGRMRKELDDRRVERGLLQELTSALQEGRGAAPYGQALTRYLKRLPETTRAQGFKRALDEESIWESVLAWNQLAGPHLAQPLRLAPAEAKNLAGKCEQFLKSYPQFPDNKTATDYQRALAALALRDHDNRSGAIEDLKRLFSDILIQDVWAVQTFQEGTYYILGDPRRDVEERRKKNEPVLLKSVGDFTGKRRDVTLKTADIREVSLSRQSVLAQKVLAWLNRLDKTWEKSLVEIAQDLATDTQMDAVLRVKLLERVLDYAARGSYPLALALTEQREYVKKAGVDTTVLWMRPGDLAAKAMRPRAAKVMSNLPALDSVVQKAEAQRQDLSTRLAATHLNVAGWLIREPGQGWQCRVPLALPRAGELLAAIPQGDDLPAAWTVIGKVVENKAVLEAANPGLLEGRLVFVRLRD